MICKITTMMLNKNEHMNEDIIHLFIFYIYIIKEEIKF